MLKARLHCIKDEGQLSYKSYETNFCKLAEPEPFCNFKVHYCIFSECTVGNLTTRHDMDTSSIEKDGGKVEPGWEELVVGPPPACRRPDRLQGKSRE